MNYFKLTQTFIEDSKKAGDLKELALLFNRLVKKMGCTHFVCLSHVDPLNPPDDAVVLTNYPLEWAEHHGKMQYHRFDPIIHTCKTKITPFTWSNDTWRYMLNIEQSDMLNEAGEFGLGEGHTIPIHPPSGYSASLSVVFKSGAVDPEALNALHLIAFFLYEAALHMKTKMVHLYNPRKQLTLRQREILELIAQGKSNWDIGTVLSISESTVKDHVSSIFKTLKVSSRQQANVKALFHGEIRYGDIDVSPPAKSNDNSGFIHLRS